MNELEASKEMSRQKTKLIIHLEDELKQKKETISQLKKIIKILANGLD